MTNFLGRVGSIGLCLAVSALLAPAAYADIVGQSNAYTFTSDHCSGGCGLDGKETVTVTVASIVSGVETLDISASLPSGWKFIASGASGSSGGPQFGFGLTSISSLTFTQGKTTWSTTGFTPLASSGSNSATSPQTVSGQTISYPGKGTFSPDGYAMSWNGGNGASSGDGNTLDFKISANGLTLASLQACSSCTDTAFFFADVLSGATGNTGLIDATAARAVPVPDIGAGLPGLIFASGGFLVWWRRKHIRSLRGNAPG